MLKHRACCRQGLPSLYQIYIPVSKFFITVSMEVLSAFTFSSIFLFDFHSFVNTYNNQTDITLVKKFGQWSYVTSSLRERMPYLTLSDPNTLLTTSANPSVDQYGTLVSRNTSHSPALWIQGAAESPQVLWYWMREPKGKEGAVV